MHIWLTRLLGIAVIGGLVWALAPGGGGSLPGQPAFSQATVGGGAGGEGGLLFHASLLPGGVEQLTVIDPRNRSLAVYHVEAATAKIQLKSVRSLVWDLQMEHFNGQSPLPSELRQVQP